VRNAIFGKVFEQHINIYKRLVQPWKILSHSFFALPNRYNVVRFFSEPLILTKNPNCSVCSDW
jgi:hypothetical protein